MRLEEKKKISEFSEFSILPYTQNQKLENLGKCSFFSNFDSCYRDSEALFFVAFNIKSHLS